MEDKIARRVKEVPASGIRKFFELVMGMEDIISLGVGEPDFITPWNIREAGIYSIEKGYTMYTSNFGLPELREAIAGKVKSYYGVDYSPEKEVLITVGVSEAFDLAVRAIVDPGEEVLIPEPSYVSYKPITTFSGGRPVVVETREEEGFKVRAEEMESKIGKDTKAMVLSYPNNPTGATLNKKDLEEVAEVASEHDLMVISDEIYDHLTYDQKHTCFSSLNGMRDNTIYLNGFSKGYAMTGWRIGYAMGNEGIIEAMMKIHQYGMLCAPVVSQMAALEAVRAGEREMRRMFMQYNRRRKFLVKRLNHMGLSCFEPQGAFYAFPSIRGSGLSSEEFATRLLERERVAVVPGNAFGESGEGYLRLAYAASMEDIKEALDRIERFLG